jgi:hypothetical protein
MTEENALELTTTRYLILFLSILIILALIITKIVRTILK